MTDENTPVKPEHPYIREVVPEDADKAPPDNVTRLPAYYYGNRPADEILQEAMGRLESVIVIGYLKNQDPDDVTRSAVNEYFASSIAAGDACVWLLQRYIHKLVDYADDGKTFGADGDIPPSA